MKQLFFVGVLVLIGAVVCGYGLWLVIRALYSLYSDWRLSKELDDIRAQVRGKQRAPQPEASSPSATVEASDISFVLPSTTTLDPSQENEDSQSRD